MSQPLGAEPTPDSPAGRGSGAEQVADLLLKRESQPIKLPARAPPESSQIMDVLPAAVYTTDAEGRITYFNEAAVALWGRRPKLNEDLWCGSWRLYHVDGTPLPHDECPMAVTLRTGLPGGGGTEVVAERPDGSRRLFVPYPRPLHDASGRLVGAVNMLVDVTDLKRAERAAQHLASIVASSDDAIVSKDLDGVIASWNEGAERLFGYSADEAVGQPISMLIPPDLHDEEPGILGRIRRGERIDHYRTMRRRKDGSLVEISLTVSPIIDGNGRIVGASKIARDITRERLAEERLRDSEARYRDIFENARVALCEEDFSPVLDMLDEVRAAGVTDLRDHFRAHPDLLAEAIGRVRMKDANRFMLELFEAGQKPELLEDLAAIFLPETRQVFLEEIVTLWEGRRQYEIETELQTLNGRRLDVLCAIAFEGERCERTLVSVVDISARKAAERAWRRQSRRLETVNRAARTIASELDLEHVAQAVTDIATELSGAKHGAFFYKAADAEEAACQLFALSGASCEAFEQLGSSRLADAFDPAFQGIGAVRSDDIRTDPRWGKEPPRRAMPQDPLPVVSYLAMPVRSRSGEVFGGLFLGHDLPGIFTEESEMLVAGIAAHAAIAIENARLHQAAQQEIAQRRRAEETKELLLNEIKHRVKNTLGTVQGIAALTFRGAPREERESFIARLHALADAHDVLTHQNWDGASASAVIRRALAPFQDRRQDRVQLDGPDAWLNASKTLFVAMALHELGTNAVKYGALSNERGIVRVAWDVSSDGQRRRLKLTWRESGGPPVAPPLRRGFGRALIERALGDEDAARFDFDAGGINCTLQIDL